MLVRIFEEVRAVALDLVRIGGQLAPWNARCRSCGVRTPDDGLSCDIDQLDEPDEKCWMICRACLHRDLLVERTKALGEAENALKQARQALDAETRF